MAKPPPWLPHEMVKQKSYPSNSAKRTAKHRARRQAEGWTFVHCQIPRDCSRILADMVVSTGMTKAEIITRLIRAYGSQFG